MKAYWFRAKRYGWGWYPSTWQGWTVILLYAIILFFIFLTLDSELHSPIETMKQFFPIELVLTAILIVVCYIKGERPSWRWGDKKKKSSRR